MLYYKNGRFRMDSISYELPDGVYIDTEFQSVIATGFEFREQPTRPTQFVYQQARPERETAVVREEISQPVKVVESEVKPKVEEQPKQEAIVKEEVEENVIPTVSKPASYDFTEYEINLDEESEEVEEEEDDGLPMFMRRLFEKG